MDPIKQLARDIENLKKSDRDKGSTPQIGTSSIEDGQLQLKDSSGAYRGGLGKQFDGTQTTASVNGPVPPTPSTPSAAAASGGLVATWDGTWVDDAITPMDFARVDVYAITAGQDPLTTTPVASITSQTWGEASVNLADGDYQVVLAAWTQSGKYALSAPSDVVTVQTATPSDGLAPAGSPAVQVVDGVSGMIFVKLTAPTNADPILGFRIYMSKVSGFIPGPSNLYTDTPQTLVGIPGLDLDTPYYFRVLARDADGPGPLAGEASGVSIKIDPAALPQSVLDAIAGAGDRADDAQADADQALADALAAANAAIAAQGKADAAATPADVEAARTSAISTAATDATNKASAAQTAATNAAAITAQAKADLAKSQAIDTAASTAQTKADLAKSQAIADAAVAAQAKADAALAAAKSDATTKADAALAAAKTDATAKDNALKTATLAAAAADATSKAETAESNAAATAAADATTKANAAAAAAQQAAQDYADSVAAGESGDALATAKTYADDQALAARNAAITAAALDATAKKEAAEATAAADALTKANAARDAAIAAAATSLYQSNNLIDNPTALNGIGRWTNQSGTLQTISMVDDPDDPTVRVYKSTATGGVTSASGYFDVDPTKCYEVRLSLKDTQIITGAQLYFGLNALGNDFNILGIDPLTGQVNAEVSNFYFAYGATPAINEYIDLVGYLLPAGTRPDDVIGLGYLGTDQGLNVYKGHAVLDPAHTKMQVRWLNYANTAGNPRDVYMKNPSVREVNFEALKKARAAQATADTKADPSYVDAAKAAAIATAATDAQNKATAAQTAAVNAAAITAQAKADLAKSQAIDSAASTAQTKADLAKSQAITDAAVAAQVKADAALTAAKADATTKANAAQSTAIATAKVETDKIISSGTDLIVNGTGMLGNNTNFHYLDFDASDSPAGAAGSFVRTGGSGTFTTDDYLPVDTAKSYMYSYSLRETGTSATSKFYAVIQPFDAFKNSIAPQHVAYWAGTLVTLAQDLKPGDTEVKFTTAPTVPFYGSAGKAAGGATHQRSLICWDYTDPGGKLWPPETYSRTGWAADEWSDGGVSADGKTITLNKPWTQGTHAAGTKVSNGTSGGTYIYPTGQANITAPHEWTRYSGVISGVATNGAVPNFATGFPNSVAFIKVGWLLNRDPAGATDPNARMAVAGVSLSDASAAQATADSKALPSYVDAAKAAAIATAATDAQNKATAAQTAAVNAAALVAQTKADAAQAAAIASASGTAQSKADAAQAAAIAAAAITAQTKADAAYTAAQADATTKANAAKAYADTQVATKGKLIVQVSAPTGSNANANNLWINASGTPPKNQPNVWNGTSWIPTTDKVAVDAAAAAVVAKNAADAAALAASTAQTSADSKNIITYSTATGSPPAAGRTTGDTHFQMAGTAAVAQWRLTGGAWTSVIVDQALLGNLDAAKITTGFLNVAILLEAGAISTDKLAATFIESGDVYAKNGIQVGDTGTGSIYLRTDIGFQVLAPDGSSIISVPLEPDESGRIIASILADVQATSITIQDFLALRGINNEFSKGSVTTLATGTTAPTTPAALAITWDKIGIDPANPGLGYSPRGIHQQASTYYTTDNFFGGYFNVQTISGGLLGRIDTKVMGSEFAPNGITVIGSYVYVLTQNRNKTTGGFSQWWIRVYNLAAPFNFVTEWQFQPPGTTFGVYSDRNPALGRTANGELLIAQCPNSAGTKLVSIWAYNTSGVQQWTLQTVWGLGNNVTSIQHGSFDVGGANKYWMTGEGESRVVVFDGSGNSLPEYYFPTPMAGGARGATWDGSRFITLDTAQLNWHSKHQWTDSALNRWWAGYSWLDSNAAGGQHETLISKLTSVNMQKRASLTVSSAALPATTGGTNDVTGIRVYFGKGSSAPASSAMKRSSVDLGDGVTSAKYVEPLSLNFAANTGAPAPFPASTPAKVRSETGGLELLGDGGGAWPLKFQSGTGIIPVAAANTTYTQVVTFDLPFKTVPSILISANTSRPDAATVSWTAVSTTGFTAVGRNSLGAFNIGYTWAAIDAS